MTCSEATHHRAVAWSHATSSKLLLANTFSHLRKLDLQLVRTEEETLLKALGRCEKTLEIVAFGTVCVTSAAHNGWQSVWRQLRDMPQLTSMDLYALSHANRSGYTKDLNFLFLRRHFHEQIVHEMDEWLAGGVFFREEKEASDGDDDEDSNAPYSVVEGKLAMGTTMMVNNVRCGFESG
jgi:hypothetical protein